MLVVSSPVCRKARVWVVYFPSRCGVCELTNARWDATHGFWDVLSTHSLTQLRGFAGVLSGELGSSLGGAALVLSCGAGGVACGLPLWLMPAPLVAASGIALFYDSGDIWLDIDRSKYPKQRAACYQHPAVGSRCYSAVH